MSKLEQLLDNCDPIPEAGCFIWKGHLKKGYPFLSQKRVHRLVMELVLGKTLSKEEVVCHRCDTPSCINPAHLFVGTQAENVLDAKAKGRLKGWRHSSETKKLFSQQRQGNTHRKGVPHTEETKRKISASLLRRRK